MDPLFSDDGFRDALHEATRGLALDQVVTALGSACEAAVHSCWLSVWDGDTDLWQVNKAPSPANIRARRAVVERIKAIARNGS